MIQFDIHVHCHLCQETCEDDEAGKLHKRKWVVAAVLDSEKGYLECLNLLYKVRLLFPDFKHFCL